MTVERFELLRRLEAMLFASAQPLGEADLAARLPEGTDLAALIEELRGMYAGRGINLVRRGKGWAFRTAADVAPFLKLEREVPRKLSRAAVETMAIIAYQQPVTRLDVEEIRGVASGAVMKGLLERGLLRVSGRRNVPGKPLEYSTTPAFLELFGLADLKALPTLTERAALEEDLLEHDSLTGLAPSVTAPWLLVHGTADDVVPCVHSRDMHAAAGPRAEYRELTGADHSFTGDGLLRMVAVVLPWLLDHA